MINIRQARIDEIETIQNLNQEVFIDNYKYDEDLIMDWTTSEKGKNYFSKLLTDSKYMCLIAEDDDKPVEYIACGVKDFGYRKSKYLEIQNMGTIPEYRSKGIGKRLIEKAKEWAKNNGYQKMFVSSYFHNSGAIEFYKRNGFKETDVSLEMKI